MELTKEYDFGVYGQDEDTILLTAYKMSKNEEGYWETNYDNEFISLELNRFEDEDTIEWLVELGQPQSFYEQYMYNDYTDYDDWLDYEQLTRTTTPTKISSWVKNLPEYELHTRGE
jgi:hypothetical protein